jgi:hypothetical protein
LVTRKGSCIIVNHIVKEEACGMKVTKRRKISSDLLDLGLKGELLDVVGRDLTYQRAMELKRGFNTGRTKREAGEIVYWVEEE